MPQVTAEPSGGGAAAEPSGGGLAQPIAAGIVAALVGFASTFALVLAGFQAVGASREQAASGLLVLCLELAVLSMVFALRFRAPIAFAWSTPGAALLISSGRVDGGYSAALGAFVVCGLLIALAGLWRQLGTWLAAIPTPLANAMLAGVLLPVCITPAKAVAQEPAMALPGVIVWAVVSRFDRRFAVPAALVATGIAIAIDPADTASASHLAPQLTAVLPSFDIGAVVGLALPLFVVTMASQNLPGMAVLSTYGYRTPLRPVLTATGVATAIGAPFGGQAVNLAAITAAMVSGPNAHAQPQRRWIATAAMGGAYVVLGLAAGAATVLVTAAPTVVIESVAGLALLGALAQALAGALGGEEHREAAVVTFAVSASAVTILSVGAPFWGLVAGLALVGAERIRTRRAPPRSP